MPKEVVITSLQFILVCGLIVFLWRTTLHTETWITKPPFKWTECGIIEMNFVLYYRCNLVLLIWSAYIGWTVLYFNDLLACIPSAGSIASGNVVYIGCHIPARPSPREESLLVKLWLNHIITHLATCLGVYNLFYLLITSYLNFSRVLML